MRSCDIDLVQFLNTSQIDIPKDGLLFHCPFVTLALEDDRVALERVLNAAHRVLMSVEDGEECETLKSADNLTLFCNLLRNLKPAKSDVFLNSIQYLISLLPSDLTDSTTYSSCRTFQHHTWLLLSSTRILVAARYLPASLDSYWKTLDETLGSLLEQAFCRVSQTKDTALTLVAEKKSAFNPPQSFVSCVCVEELWKLVISKIAEVSTDHATSDLKFWNLFNRHINILVAKSDNISGLMWTLEQIVSMVAATCPTLPTNWGVVQELTKLSCVTPTHLKQTLISLTNISEVWQSNIVIVMTLQQHFARSLSTRSTTLVPMLSPRQFIRIPESIVKRDIVTEDTVFQHFLRFYSRSLDKIPEMKKVTLIRRLFQTEKFDHRSLASMSAEGLQNLGLLVACCLYLTKSDCLATQVNKMFGSLSGDMISSTSSPTVMVSLQIGITLVCFDVGIESQLLLEQLTIMLNRISEDYVRETESRRCQIFGVFSKMLDDLECLAGCSKFDPVTFLGTWVEMFLTEGEPMRCTRVLTFCQFVLAKASVNETSVAMVNKFVVKPIQKFLKSKSETLEQSLDIAAAVLAKFCLLLQHSSEDSEKQTKNLSDLLAVITPPNCSYSFSAEFLYKVLSQLDGDRAVLFSNHETAMANVVFNRLCECHVKHQDLVDPASLEKISVLLHFLLGCPQLQDLKSQLQTTSPQKENLLLDIVSELKESYQSKEFSEGQHFKNFVWRMFEGVTGTLHGMLEGQTAVDGHCKRLYQLVAHMFDKISDLLYNPSRPNSPVLILFQTFFLKREQLHKKQMFQVLPKVFWGLSKISYKSNNLFFKDIMKVFGDIYAHVADRDWELRKEDPFLVTLFTPSFADESEDSVRSFRKSLMSYIAEPNTGYCKLPKSPDKLVVLLFFLGKLEQSTKDREILEYDFVKLYPFLMQVLYTCVTLKSTSPEHVKPMVSALLKHFLKQTTQAEVDVILLTQSFISKNVNTTNGPVFLIETLKELLEFGDAGIVAKLLDYMESTLNGRAHTEFSSLRNDVFNRLS